MSRKHFKMMWNCGGKGAFSERLWRRWRLTTFHGMLFLERWVYNIVCLHEVLHYLFSCLMMQKIQFALRGQATIKSKGLRNVLYLFQQHQLSVTQYNSGISKWQSWRSCAVVGQVHSWKLRGVVISHSFAFSTNRRLSTLVSMLELSPPLPYFSYSASEDYHV
jgi:hypothetical protein